ncbi:3-keto-5-aminohexanoate cleavage protein [Roseateles sp. SL47]|uniref:3-keto-5-aminohexanoate cleavage protein n=1 Tax=Roseateles sp. SL47 TaxID=2995138 RepID=UPI00226DBC8F|nr:3-keto-5-aminohexanoate cleavage protein [Roseateles sp. SL47]WAC73065.1 3-keto-5-aminohexanoate cleavage protein [Roseateles sp. SL47]
MKEFIITAAPVGAVPRHVRPSEPKFIPDVIIESLTSADSRQSIIDALTSGGWERIGSGGIGIGQAAFVGDDLLRAAGPHDAIRKELLEQGWSRVKGGFQLFGQRSAEPGHPGPIRLPPQLLSAASTPGTRSIVLSLTAQGWSASDTDGLVWTQGSPESYLPPDLVAHLVAAGPDLLQAWLDAGWQRLGPGYWRNTLAASPYLPVEPSDIVQSCVEAVREGAAILHLHTRDRSATELRLPGFGASISVSSQRNHIDEAQYDEIIPRLHDLVPHAILNVSTSVRGGGSASSSPSRRSHLKPYGPRSTYPDMSSLSPGAVVFQAGGGYDNLPEFLQAQLQHGRDTGVRPEVEVFNGSILEAATGPYRDVLVAAGVPTLFMLVAGVDQHGVTAQGELYDDSLIPVKERKEAVRLLANGDPASIEEAGHLLSERLRPVVARIRGAFSSAKISILLPGALQAVLVPVAIALDLDGIRVGLEDGLNVEDSRVPGGVRRATTAEQVRQLRCAIERAGARVLSPEEAREQLNMVQPDIALWRAVVQRLAPLAPAGDGRFRAPAQQVIDVLADLRGAYLVREEKLAQAFAAASARVALDTDPHGARRLADQATLLIREHGLYARLFIEERDRYPAEGARAFEDVYRLQALNFAREVLIDHKLPNQHWTQALKALAHERGLHDEAYLIKEDQFKGASLRFLEYLTHLSSRYNADRTVVINTQIRQEAGYSETMALLFGAINQMAVALRHRSEADPKQAGLSIHQWADGGEIRDMDAATALTAIERGAWVVLPSTPTTHYSGGLRLSHGLTSTFGAFLRDKVYGPGTAPDVIGITHTGQEEDGQPLIESAMLNNRFALNTAHHEHVLSVAARLIYEQLMLPRLVEQPDLLDRWPSGLVRRDEDGHPLNQDGTLASRLSFQALEALRNVRFLAHSSGIATIQQIDTGMRRDLPKLGYSAVEQEEIFGRAVVISLASACDVQLGVSGTGTVDITAYNDIRSVGGTTTPDYVAIPPSLRQTLAQLMATQVPATYRYGDSHWSLQRGPKRKLLLRRLHVLLREDPVRLHDGHSIRRYLEGAPDEVLALLTELAAAHPTARLDLLIRHHIGRLGSAV